MKTECVIESFEDFDALRRWGNFGRGEDLSLWCSCSETQEKLKEQGISYKPLDNELLKPEWDSINAWAKRVSLRWFNDPEFSKILTVEGLNVGDLVNRPISHLLIYRLKNFLLAEKFLERSPFERTLIFNQIVKKGSREFPEKGTINRVLAGHLKGQEKIFLTATRQTKKTAFAFFKEILRLILGSLYSLTCPVKIKPVYVGMGDLKYLLHLLRHLQSAGPVAFVDQDFHWPAYKSCKKAGIQYLLGKSLISWQKGMGLHYKIWNLKRSLKLIQAKIESCDWLIYKGRRLEQMGEAIAESLSLHAAPRLRQKLVLESIASCWQSKCLILHEDIDAFRASAMAARQFGIPVAVLSHGVPPTSSDWSEAASGVAVGDVIVNSEFERDKYLLAGYPSEKLHVLGLPRYDLIYKRTNQKTDPHQQKKIVLYCPHMLTRVTKRKKGYLGIHTLAGETRQNSIALLRACQEVGCSLVIKPHGNSEDFHLWEELVRQYGGKNTRLVLPQSDIFGLLADCDLVVVTFSTVAIEAMLFNKNVITMNFTGRPDLHPYAERGIALGVYDSKALPDAIRKCLFDPETNRELSRNRQREMEYFGGRFDGKNTERVVEYLQLLIHPSLQTPLERRAGEHEKVLSC